MCTLREAENSSTVLCVCVTGSQSLCLEGHKTRSEGRVCKKIEGQSGLKWIACEIIIGEEAEQYRKRAREVSERKKEVSPIPDVGGRPRLGEPQ